MNPEALAREILEEDEDHTNVEAYNGATWSHCGWMGIAITRPCPSCGKSYNDA